MIKICDRCGNEFSNRRGVICNSCYNRDYYQKNKEKIKQAAAKWSKENRDKRKIIEKRRDQRVKEERAEKRHRNKLKRICRDCGEDCYDKQFVRGKYCIKCYKRVRYRERNPVPPDRFCDCGKRIGFRSKFNKCRVCRDRERRHSDPEYREQVYKRTRRNSKTEKGMKSGRIAVIRRRARLAKVKNTLTKSEWENVLALYGNKCAYCGKPGKMTVDHVVPISKGGENTVHNVVPACKSCNCKKCDGDVLNPVQNVLI